VVVLGLFCLKYIFVVCFQEYLFLFFVGSLIDILSKADELLQPGGGELEVTFTGSDLPAPGKRAGAKEVVVYQATNFKNKLLQQYTFERHWDANTRKREFDTTIARLQRLGRKAGTFLIDDAATQLSAECFDLSEKLESRQALFERVRNDFADVIKNPLTAIEQRLLKEATPEVLSSIITMNLQLLVEKVANKAELVQYVCAGLCFKHVPG